MQSFYPKSLSLLIDLLSKLPGIGKKTAERLAFSLIKNKDTQYIYELSDSINKIKENIKVARICNCLTDLNYCSICSISQ